METHNCPIYMYFTLVNVGRVSTKEYADGYVSRVFRLKLTTQTGHIVTMILEEVSNGDLLYVPVHHMYIETDETKKPYFICFSG